MTRRVHRFAISRRANAELAEAIEYIRRDSPRNAREVAGAIRDKIDQLRSFPDSAPIDVAARTPPPGATPRVAHASGFAIRYVFPLTRDGAPTLYVVSIRRAGRLPLEDTEYQQRFIQEVGAAYARRAKARAGSAP